MVTVSDGELIDTQNISVTVNAINDAPIASDNISGTTLEDESILISLSAIDVDGDNLIFSLDDDASNASGVLDGSFATYSPNTNYNGDDSFSFSVSDGLESSSASVTLSVSAVNDAPVLESVSDVSFDEDGSGSASLSGSDVDGDVLTYSITGGSDITATLDGSDVSFSTTENYNGSEVFNVSVSDGEYTDSQSITVTVNAINDDPVATSASAETAEDLSLIHI